MEPKYKKKYDKILEKINTNSYNIKKEYYQSFNERIKENTIDSFFFFSKALFDDREPVRDVKTLWETKNKISYKKFKQLRLANFYLDLYLALVPFYSSFMSVIVDEALQVAYHTKGSYQEKALAAFEYLENK